METIYDYYKKHPEVFIKKSKIITKIIYRLLALAWILIAIKPDLAIEHIIPLITPYTGELGFPPLIIRIIGWVFALVWVFAWMIMSSNRKHKPTNENIKKVVTLGRLSYTTLSGDEILEEFNNGNIEIICALWSDEHCSHFISIHEASKAQKYYIELGERQEYSPNRVAPIQVVEWELYKKIKPLIKKIKRH